MRMRPQLDGKVDDEAPRSAKITAYDERHLITYLRLLDAQAQDTDWREAAASARHCNSRRGQRTRRAGRDSRPDLLSTCIGTRRRQRTRAHDRPNARRASRGHHRMYEHARLHGVLRAVAAAGTGIEGGMT